MLWLQKIIHARMSNAHTGKMKWGRIQMNFQHWRWMNAAKILYVIVLHFPFSVEDTMIHRTKETFTDKLPNSLYFSQSTMASYSFSSPGYVNIPPYYNTTSNGYSGLNFQYSLPDSKTPSYLSDLFLIKDFQLGYSTTGTSAPTSTSPYSTQPVCDSRLFLLNVSLLFVESRSSILSSISADTWLSMLPIVCIPFVV